MKSDAPTTAQSIKGALDASRGMMRLVGLGTSAGGLQALKAFFSRVPLNSGLAYVVLQHMGPDHKTSLSHLLSRVTRLSVHDVQELTVVQANAVYVMPSGGELKLAQGCLHFRASTSVQAMHYPIDVFFKTLAQEQGHFAIGVVLSGMGQDGVAGLQAIHAQGGLTFAQQPETAGFTSMPQSAIDAGCVQVVAAPEDMPERIIQMVQEQSSATGISESSQGQALAVILNLLHQHSKSDLSLYKSSTLMRRIKRRMSAHGLTTMEGYIDFLRGNTQELDFLFAEMLIGVTSFFRDPEVWSDLKNQVLPDLIRSPAHEGTLRAWIVGCSSGEEAYTLAMVFQELKDSQPSLQGLRIQIFATDLNTHAIAVARKAWYCAKAVQGLDKKRLERFFTPHLGGFSIRPDIRGMVLFARHDVVLDPPFTQLDVLSCRNVLIYFNAALQHRLLPLFHYSLRSGGVLILGGAETVGRSQALFTPLVSKSRIFRRNDLPLSPGSVDFPVQRQMLTPMPLQQMTVPSPSPPNLQTLVEKLLLQIFTPAAVLVNEAGDILYIHGRTGRYLEPAAGKANWNVHVMAIPCLRASLAIVLRQALRAQQAVSVQVHHLDDEMPCSVLLTVHPMKEPQNLAGMALVIFKEMDMPVGSSGVQAMPSPDDSLVQELHNAREEILTLRHEMKTFKETLQASNESLQSMNEELQSANEELTTSKEEGQSMNEELQTLNGELQSRLDELALAQSDMQNLLNSTDIATLFLDNDLNVRRYTEQAEAIFHFREGDVGRPLSDLANTLDYPDLKLDLMETLRTLTPCTKSIASTDGRWFTIRIMPYRTLSNTIQGAVLTFVDITQSKALELQLRQTQASTLNQVPLP
ncbi:chemotaxis protein CheB [Limnohabitans planktonicus]|uniref:protein-glutamate O-methyltransferase n=1 Tax=Limnohabitans planktonicus II-D5 TaxID=1293045 RepID=A0A2T7UET3_9BURK|nr:chemotaxis protein CheB [Limnohabitans planktonicus]PVE43118.1 chemotaxis protein CheB [Limnohabitans planktonicus II-D5]